MSPRVGFARWATTEQRINSLAIPCYSTRYSIATYGIPYRSRPEQLGPGLASSAPIKTTLARN